MAEYIEREAAIEEVDNADVMCDIQPDAYRVLRRYIERIPAADVVPVRHGRWDDKVVAFYRKCSECGCCVEWNKKPFLFGDGDYNFCPNCGANMRDNTQKTSVDEEVKHG